MGDDGEGGRLRFGLVERGVGVCREVWVSEIELLCMVVPYPGRCIFMFSEGFRAQLRGVFQKIDCASYSPGRGF